MTGSSSRPNIASPTARSVTATCPAPGLDGPIVDYDASGNRSFLSADERGSIISASDSSGALLAINRYDEYGKPGASNSGRFQFTGQKWIGEAELYDYKARSYLPHLGIFAQVDPRGYKDSANLYSYTIADPVTFTDPFGLDVTCTGSHIPRESCGDIPGLSCMGECRNFLSSDQRKEFGFEDRFGEVREGRGPSGQLDLSAIAACVADANACLAHSPDFRSSIGFLDPLGSQDRRAVNALLNNPVAQYRIGMAWSQTLSTGNEFVFFVFLNTVNGNAYNFTLSRIYGGVSPWNPGSLFALHANLYGNFFASVHTHPFLSYLSVFPSTNDVRFGQVHNSITIIVTIAGFVIGP